jgi:hypothetical protein
MFRSLNHVSGIGQNRITVIIVGNLNNEHYPARLFVDANPAPT